MTFDILLVCAQKDYNKLPHVMRSIEENVFGFDRFVVIAQTLDALSFIPKTQKEVVLSSDNEGLPGVDRSGWRYRPNWCFQQHLKLFQTLTSDWYLTVDCDTIFNRPIPFFNDGKPIYYTGKMQFHPPYFAFNGYMLDLIMDRNISYITDLNLFYRPMIAEMLYSNGYTIQSFIEKSQRITDKYCHMAEPELYGRYIAKYHPTMYEDRRLVMGQSIGKLQNNIKAFNYTDREIRAAIDAAKSQDYDTISLHSWFDETGVMKND